MRAAQTGAVAELSMKHAENISRDGHRSPSTSTHQVPIMDGSRLRMLPFGTGVLLLRAARTTDPVGPALLEDP
jgi:hypothetical protein